MGVGSDRGRHVGDSGMIRSSGKGMRASRRCACPLPLTLSFFLLLGAALLCLLSSSSSSAAPSKQANPERSGNSLGRADNFERGVLKGLLQDCMARKEQHTPTLMEALSRSPLKHRGSQRLRRRSTGFSLLPPRTISRDPRLCVITRTYPKEFYYLPAFLASWTQMDLDTSIYLVVTEKRQDLEILQPIVASANVLAGHEAVEVLPITVTDAAKIFPQVYDVNEYGYAYTDASINYLLEPANGAECDYFLITNGDNLYSKHLPENLLPHMRNKVDLIAFDFVSHYEFKHLVRREEGLVDTGFLKLMHVYFQRGAVDLGAMVVSAEFLKRTGQRFILQDSNDNTEADGYFAQRAVRLAKKAVRLGQVLYMHQ